MNNTKKSEAESRFEPVAIESSACQQRLNADAEILLARRNREHMNLVRKSFTEDELVTMAENRDLRQLIIAATGDCLLTRDEYLQIRKIIISACERYERSG